MVPTSRNNRPIASHRESTALLETGISADIQDFIESNIEGFSFGFYEANSPVVSTILPSCDQVSSTSRHVHNTNILPKSCIVHLHSPRDFQQFLSTYSQSTLKHTRSPRALDNPILHPPLPSIIPTLHPPPSSTLPNLHDQPISHSIPMRHLLHFAHSKLLTRSHTS